MEVITPRRQASDRFSTDMVYCPETEELFSVFKLSYYVLSTEVGQRPVLSPLNPPDSPFVGRRPEAPEANPIKSSR
jgi:hypothetical protein